MHLHRIVREMSQADDFWRGGKDNVIDLILNDDGASAPQESDEAEPGQINVIGNHVSSSLRVCDNSDGNLAENLTPSMQRTSSDIVFPVNALGKMGCAEGPSVSKPQRTVQKC